MKNEEKKLTSDNGSAVDSGDKRGKRLDRKKLIYLFSTIGFSAFFCAFYYCSMELSSKSLDYYYFFPIVMFGYMAALTVLVFVYIIYNRGFSRKGVTVDMLPDEWSDEKKLEFVESGKKRLERSKWLLVFIISFLFTFIVEAILLFMLPMVEGLFK